MDDILDRPSTPSSSNYWPAAAQPSLPNPAPLSVGPSSHQSGVATLVSSGSKVSAGGWLVWVCVEWATSFYHCWLSSSKAHLFCLGLLRKKNTFQMLVC